MSQVRKWHGVNGDGFVVGLRLQSRELHIERREGALEDDLLQMGQFLLKRLVRYFDHVHRIRHVLHRQRFVFGRALGDALIAGMAH